MLKGFVGALAASLIWSSAVLGVLTLAFYLLPPTLIPGDEPWHTALTIFKQWPIPSAVVLSSVFIVLFSFVTRRGGQLRYASSQSYTDIETGMQRLKALRDKLESKADELYSPIAAQEFKAHLDGLREQMDEEQAPSDTQWVEATGYIEAYRRLARAEEAYIEAAPDRAYPIRVAIHDWLRLQGSGMKDEQHLIDQLLCALRVLSPRAAECLVKSDVQSKDIEEAEKKADDQEGKPVRRTLEETTARATLREVDYAVNEFRSDRYGGIVRARNRLALTTVVSGFVAYGLLCIGIAAVTDPMLIVIAVAFYLVGAVAGLFGLLRSDAQADSAIPDYGLSVVRTIQTPLSSGLAAVVGVVLVKLAADGKANLLDVFDLTKNANGLLVAAAFGLTPQVLIDRLTRQADQYKNDLKKSAAGDRREPDSAAAT